MFRTATGKATAILTAAILMFASLVLFSPHAQAATTITTFAAPVTDCQPTGITTGPDGNLWLCEYEAGVIAKVTTAGVFTQYAIPDPSPEPVDIAVGSDGALWFTDYGTSFAPAERNRIGRITTSGVITMFNVPTLGAEVMGITAGPDGNLWFTESATGKIGRCTVLGAITEFNIPTADAGPVYITTGPDGALWFTEAGANKVGRITTSGTFGEFALPHADSGPYGITMGVDGNLWITEQTASKLARVTPSGTVTEFAQGVLMMNINSGPDGALWYGGFAGSTHYVYRTTVSGVTTRYQVPAGITMPQDLTTGPDGNVWFSEADEHGNKIGRVTGFPTDTWYLAEGTTAWGFDEYISIANPNAAAATAIVTYMTDAGAVNGGEVPLPANSQTTVNPRDKLGDKDFSTMVVCKEGKSIAVDRTMSWTGTGAAASEGHGCVGVTMPNKTWYLAEGSSKWGFECWLLIQNPTSTEAECEVTYMIEGAAPKTVNKTVPANSRQSFNIADDIGSEDASIKVDASVPVIPERAMYRNNRREGHDSIGTTSPATNYYLAEGTTGWGFTTYVLVQNPNSTACDVTVTYMTPEGPKPQAAFKMDANSRKTIRVNDVLPGTDLSTRVTGTLPIIAERAMYWDAGSGEACHDSIGMAGAHQSFTLPDGETTNGRETWTLIQNPNASDVTVDVTYMTPAGSGNVTKTVTIPANSRTTFNMLQHSGINGRAAITATCTTAGKKIMVERAMYWNNRGAGTDTIGGYSD
ncbi:MAG: Vgb family protein [Candidatus Geothermincolia bacterium]